MKKENKGIVRMVTRTINYNTAKIEVADMTERAFIVKEYEYSGPVLREDVLLKVARKQLDSDTIRVLSVVGQDTKQVRYGMTEEDFIKYGHVIEDEEELDYGDQ